MIHHLKNGVILSNWVQVGSRGDWLKHRIDREPKPTPKAGITPVADVIRLVEIQSLWDTKKHYGFNVQGEALKYIESAYIAAYGHDLIPEQSLQEAKERIDAFLSKIDKLIVFS